MNPYQHHTDTQLVALLIEGNERAFAVIYERYAFDLYKYARKNIQESEDCREIIQDIFESLWKRHGELQHVTVLDAYLFRMVKYKVIRYSQHKTVKRKYAEHYQLFETVYDSIPESDDRTPENIEATINGFLAELPQRCQMVFRLRLEENLSNKDIAKRLNITHGAVRNYVSDALSHLRTAYQKFYKLG